jgi:hypothetical protein
MKVSQFLFKLTLEILTEEITLLNLPPLTELEAKIDGHFPINFDSGLYFAVLATFLDSH